MVQLVFGWRDSYRLVLSNTLMWMCNYTGMCSILQTFPRWEYIYHTPSYTILTTTSRTHQSLTRTNLWSAAAAPVANNGHHSSTEAGASFLAASTHCPQRGVWLAAVCTLLGVNLSAHTGALQHAAAGWCSHLPTKERRRWMTFILGTW